jgi:hypothetical protein
MENGQRIMTEIPIHRMSRGGLLPVLAAAALVGAIGSAGCSGTTEAATGPGGTKLPQNMSQAERVAAIKNNPNYSEADKQQAIQNVEAQARMSRGEGGTAPPPGYQP